MFDDQDPLESGKMFNDDGLLRTSQALYCYLADVSKTKPDHQKLKKTNQTKKKCMNDTIREEITSTFVRNTTLHLLFSLTLFSMGVWKCGRETDRETDIKDTM